MSNQEEEPLDPAVEAIRVKMVRLLAISGGIMMLGLMAVLISIVYKVNQVEVATPAQVPQTGQSELVIPKGATLVQTSQADGRLTLTLRLEDGTNLIQIHNAKGTLVASYAVREQ